MPCRRDHDASSRMRWRIVSSAASSSAARHRIGRERQARHILDEVAGPGRALMGEQERIVGVEGPDDVVVGDGLRVDLGQRFGARIAGAGEHDGQPRRRGARRGVEPLQAIRPEIGVVARRSRRPARSSARRRPVPDPPSPARAPWCGRARHSGRTSPGRPSPRPCRPSGCRRPGKVHVDHDLEPGRVDQARRFHDRRDQPVAQRRRSVGQERRRVDRHPHEVEAGGLQRGKAVCVEALAPFRKGQDRRPGRPSDPLAARSSRCRG